VIVDEAQDMSFQAMKLLRSIVDKSQNDIFIVGDGHQRIYGKHKIVLSRCGINIRGRARKLRLNYRTTDEIRNWAVKLLDGKTIDDLDGGIDTNHGYKSLTHGPEPLITSFESNKEQSAFISEYVKNKETEGESLNKICIVARTNSEVDRIHEDLVRFCVEVEKITADSSGENKNNDNVLKIATMHRVKGLEFDEMILASINDDLVPLDAAIRDKGDPVEERQADLEERCLVYVAITRAKKRTQILSYGKKSPYLQ
jgi:superfamily I DNA/RNA helicase